MGLFFFVIFATYMVHMRVQKLFVVPATHMTLMSARSAEQQQRNLDKNIERDIAYEFGAVDSCYVNPGLNKSEWETKPMT
jgi:hypothetical protein